MFTRRNVSGLLVVVLGLVAVVIVALPVYGHCGKCAGDGKAQAAALKETKMTLASAATLAEGHTKGIAVRAAAHMHEGACFVEVHCMVDEKIVAVKVDCKTRAVAAAGEVSSLEAQAPSESAAAEAGAASPEARLKEAQSLLDKATSATEAGKLDKAEDALTKLEGMQNLLPETMQQKITSARTALDAAKAAKDVKSKIPGLGG
jgi:hypothetical protein